MPPPRTSRTARRSHPPRPSAGPRRSSSKRASSSGGQAPRSRSSSRRSAAPKPGSPTTSIGAGARGLGVAQHEPRLDGAVVAVELQPHDGVDRLARRRRQRAAATERDAARARAAGREAERDVAPLPHRPRVVEQRARDEQRRLRVADPERREPLELLGEPDVERVAGHDGVDALDRHEVVRREHRGGVRHERLAERVHAPARDRQPGGGAVAAVAQQLGARRLAARRAGRTPGSSAPTRCPRRRRARSAPPAGGGARRSATRRSRSRRGASRRRRARTRARRAGSRPPAARPRTGSCVSTSRRSTLTASSSAATARARWTSVGQQQLEPRVGAVQPAGRVDPRRQPEADRAGVDPARVHARDLHQRLQPRLARRRERAQPLAHQAAVLADQRHAVGDRRERDDVEVRVGLGGVDAGAVEQRAGEHVRDAGGAQLRARVAADARVHDRRVGQPAVGARRVVVGDDDVEAGGARGGDLRPPR